MASAPLLGKVLMGAGWRSVGRCGEVEVFPLFSRIGLKARVAMDGSLIGD